jgi:hypothetical protein
VVAYASQQVRRPALSPRRERRSDARLHFFEFCHYDAFMNLPRKVSTADEPFKHVIAEYRVREHHVTCVCGWSGNAPGKVSSPDDWNAHLLAVRGRRR